MTKVLGKYARFYLDHHDIYLKSFEASQNLETKIVDATNYAQDFEESEVLQAQGTFELTARLENAYRASGDVDAAYSPACTVSGAQSISTTEITVNDSSGVAVGDIAVINDSEKVLVLDNDETNEILHVRRGYSDTTPTALTDGWTVKLSGDRLIDKLLYEEAMAPSGVISNTPVPMSLIVRKTPAVGDNAQMFRGLPGLTFSSPVADLASMRCSVKETGAIHMGKVLAVGSYAVTTAGGPVYGSDLIADVGIQLGKVWKAARFVYHVYSFVVDAATPTLTITIERDDAEGMPTKADYLELETGLDDVKGEWNELTTPTTDDWWRVRFDCVGASAECTIGIVVIGYVE